MSSNNLVSCSFTWMIENFMEKICEADDSLISPAFGSPTDPNISWVLSLKGDGNLIKMRLKPQFRTVKQNLNCKRITLSGTDGIRSCLGDETSTNVFIKRDDDLGHLLHYFWPSGMKNNEDEVTIQCKIDYIAYLPKSQGNVVIITRPSALEAASCSNGPSTSQQAADIGSILYKNDEYSDMILSARGKEFKVHKIVLATRSPVFAAMFKSNMEENLKGKVTINDVNPEIVDEMLYFIYTGKEPNNLQKFACQLLMTAEKYMLEPLKKMAEEKVISSLSAHNASDILALGEQLNSDLLKRAAIDFITVHIIEIISTHLWKTRAQKHTSAVQDLLSAVTSVSGVAPPAKRSRKK